MHTIIHIGLNPLTGPWGVIKSLSSFQKSRGHDVYIGIISDKGWPIYYEKELLETGIPNLRLAIPETPGTLSYVLARIFRRAIGRWIETVAKDDKTKIVLHFHDAWMSGAFLPIIGTTRRVTTVVTIHGMPHKFSCQPVRKTIHKYFAMNMVKHADHIVSVDRYTLQHLEKHLAVPSCGISVIPNGIAKPSENIKLERAAKARTKTLTVGYVGSLTAAKGWRIAGDAIVRLRESGYNISYIIAGDGRDKKEVQEYTSRYSDFMEYRGYVTNPRESVMREMDVISLLSMTEGLPMVLIEALSIGLPIIATPVGGIPDIVEQGANGYLIARDQNATEQVLRRIYENRELLLELSNECFNKFSKCFEVESVASQYLNVYGLEPKVGRTCLPSEVTPISWTVAK